MEWDNDPKVNKTLIIDEPLELESKGVPCSQGLEDLNMGIAVRPDFRGGDNTSKNK